MARRKAAAAQLEQIKSSISRSIAAEARKLITIDADHGCWKGDGLRIDDFGDGFKGAIVRIMPPADATDERIETIGKLCEMSGAVATKILPRRAIGAIGAAAEQEKKADGKEERALGLREAVHAVAARMATADRDALRVELDSVMDEVGL
jgi:hypothetical protein